MDLARSLPAPVNDHVEVTDMDSDEEQQQHKRAFARPTCPPYGQRKGFVPREDKDFADGGAFPEIHVAQFPLDMGRKDKRGGGSTVALMTDQSGKLKYDALLGQGRTGRTVIHSQYTDLVPKNLKDDDLALPDEEQVAKETAETKEAIDKIVLGKTQAVKTAQPGSKQEPTYIRYTPANQGPNAPQRIIRMVEQQVDPLEPPKFKHKKVPRAGAEPPVPTMHSPPRKLTAQDQEDWKIPPCVSNWKNAKGYTIPLDKRQGADGRAQSTVEINDNFAKLAESLLVAQETAAEAIKERIAARQQQERREKELKEEELRRLAQEARMGRTGGLASSNPRMGGDDLGAALDAADKAARGRSDDMDVVEEGGDMPPPRGLDAPLEKETREEREDRRRRDQIREERRRERERERRLEELERQGVKKSKLTRDRDRDISEKIALGQAQKTGGGEIQYDQRLFNQSEGMDSGFGEDDNYNIYDKPLFKGGSSANALYKPKKTDDEQYGEESVGAALKNARFKIDKEFSGTDPRTRGEQKDRPVEFEKDKPQEDLFGLDEFFSDAKRARGALDKVGGGGTMAASGESDLKADRSGSSGGRRMDFQRGSR